MNADNVISGTSDSLNGYNPFVYCFNNPINMDDASGNWPKWIKKAANAIAKAVKPVVKTIAKAVKPIVKAIQKSTSKIDMTYSTGTNFSGTVGAFNGNLQVGTSVDTKGNVAAQITLSGGFTTSDKPGASISRYDSITNAPNINKLEGDGYSLGGSYCKVIEYIPVVGGAEIEFVPDNTLDTTYYGLTTLGGIGGSPGPEIHANWGKTFTIPYSQFNVYEIGEWCYIKIMEW